jgi:ABC-type amino acid transport substrate-binding protein
VVDEVDTTEPYYASTYVFVSRKHDALGIASLADPRLRTLKIGVHLIGDDSTPPTMALGQEGIVNNVHGYMIQADFDKPNPPARLIEAVEKKDVDVAAVWGPLGGYFSKSSPVPLSVTPMTGTARFAPLQFQFAIAVLARERPAIRNILVGYGVPLVDLKGGGHG